MCELPLKVARIFVWGCRRAGHGRHRSGGVEPSGKVAGWGASRFSFVPGFPASLTLPPETYPGTKRDERCSSMWCAVPGALASLYSSKGTMPRPKIEISDEQLRQAELLAGYGLTQDQIADVIGISHRTFSRKQDEPRVLAALQKGRAEAQHKIGKSIFEQAMDGNMTAAIWWEKTRAGRSERVIQQHEGKSVEINIGRAAPPAEDQRSAPRRAARGIGGLKAV